MDKSVSSDLTDQALAKPHAAKSNNGTVESTSDQTGPAVFERAQKRKRTKDVIGLKKGKKSPAKRRKDDGVNWRAAVASSPDEWSDELKSQIIAAGYDLNEVAEKIKKRRVSVDKKGKKKPFKRRKDDGVDWRAAVASSPDEWSDELKSQIIAAGYDLNEVAEKIKKRQMTTKDQ